MAETTSKEIHKFEKSNDKSYDKAISDALFTLHNSFYDVLIDSFERNTETFVVKNYGFNERLTQLCGFNFFNTSSYLNLIGIGNNVLQYIQKIMSEESKEFTWTFENAATALLDAKQKVENERDFKDMSPDYLNKLYNDYVDALIHQVMNNYIPKLVYTCQQLVNEEIDQDLLTKKLKDLNYKTVATMSSHATATLNKLLKEIYSKFGLNKKASQKTSEGSKIPFSDFDKSKTLFKANFDDEEEALNVLGLDKAATWAEIKKAYKKLAFEYHPDRNKSKYASNQMEKINSAYNLLKRKINN